MGSVWRGEIEVGRNNKNARKGVSNGRKGMMSIRDKEICMRDKSIVCEQDKNSVLTVLANILPPNHTA